MASPVYPVPSSTGKTAPTVNRGGASRAVSGAKASNPNVTTPGHAAYVRSETNGFASNGKTVRKPSKAEVQSAMASHVRHAKTPK